jgi:hypothetical protein
MSASRLLLILSAVLFVIGALCSFDVIKGYSAEGFALLALACWVGFNVVAFLVAA